MPDQTMRDQLASIRESLTTTRDLKVEKVKERDAAKQAFAKTDLTDVEKVTESAEFKAAEQAVAAVGELDDKINDLTVAEAKVMAMLGEPAAAPSRDGNGPEDAIAAKAAMGRWNPDTVLQGDKYKAFIESGLANNSKAKFGAIQLGQLATREQVAAFMSPRADVGSDNMVGATAADRRGFVLPNLKPLTLLDLVPVGTTDSDIVQYVQILTIPEAAAETAPGALKPEASFTTEDKDAPVRTIAAWLKVRKQALRDIGTLRAILGQLLPYDVRRRIESQMLAGNGVGQNLEGIYNMDGVHHADFVAGDNTADSILRAMTLIILSDGDPNFTALHPLTGQDLMLMRENQSARTGQYLYGSPAVIAAPSIWGLAITKNRVVPEAEPLVGDSMASTLLFREGVNTLVSDSDQDDFVRNRVTILAEASVAYPVWRPTSYAIGATDESAS
jgi:HK97 family phage major capsid protein